MKIRAHSIGAPSEFHNISLERIGQPHSLQELHWPFNASERFKPQRAPYTAVEETGRRMVEPAACLNARTSTPQQTAPFLIQCVLYVRRGRRAVAGAVAALLWKGQVSINQNGSPVLAAEHVTEEGCT
jgi:hypothetical protein